MKKLISRFITVVLLLSIPLVLSTSAFSQDYKFVLKWGEHGSGPGQFLYPRGIAVDSKDNIYVADTNNNRIQKFDSNGNFILEWGSKGSEPGQFLYPQDVAVDSANNVYVVEYYGWSGCIQKFDSNGGFIAKRDTSQEAPLLKPRGIAVDSFNNVYVADYGDNRIKKFDSNLAFITRWIHVHPSMPFGIEVDSNDAVYVIGEWYHLVQKFDSNGNLFTEWGSQGCLDGQFSATSSIAIDSGNNVFVANYHQAVNICIRVQKFDSNGGFITKFGRGGNGDGEFGWPRGIAVDSEGNVYVVDSRISKFAPLIINQPPVTLCKDIEIPVDENCEASITAEDLDGGSYDPDEGDAITLSIDNIGPFFLGEHYVNLTVTDDHGESDTCQAKVTVIDDTPPTIAVSDPVCINVEGKGKMANKLTISAQDNCSSNISISIDSVEVFNNGGQIVEEEPGEIVYEIVGSDIYVYPSAKGWTIVVTITATDESGNSATQTFTKLL